jgi:hypothetical protein
MDEVFDYLLTARSGGREAKAPDDAPSPATMVPVLADRRDAGGAGAPDLLDQLLERLGDETVRRAIVRLIVPR